MDESGLARTDLGLFLNLNATDAALPTYRRLFLALRTAILSGRVQGGVRLPSTRALAAQLGIARNTVKSAYELLQAEGYLHSRHGAGCFVAALPVAQGLCSGAAGALAYNAGDEDQMPAVRARPGLLQPGLPALDQFPYRRWQRALQAAASTPALTATDPQGDAGLRVEIARWLGLQRGMQVAPSQILITSGSQQGLYLIANQLTTAGDRVLLERPGFSGTEQAMRLAGACVDHIDQQALARTDTLGAARLMVLTPSRNFPMGHTLAADRRLALLNWAAGHDAWLVEDDYDSEYAAGAALSALFSLDRAGRVIYAGTFSRTLFPGLRLGYLVLPPAWVAAFVAVRRIMDGGLSSLPQRALAAFMASGDYSRHLRRMKRLYAQRRARLEQQLAESPLRALPIIDAGGGMHLCLGLPDTVDDIAIAQRLAGEGVGARALRLYDPEGRPGLVLGFAADAEDAMRRGVDRLVRVLAPRLRAPD
jgi:GntR family transcriptional regulator/MocR family aminotransferase